MNRPQVSLKKFETALLESFNNISPGVLRVIQQETLHLQFPDRWSDLANESHISVTYS